jgi:hypothetical protein
MQVPEGVLPPVELHGEASFHAAPLEQVDGPGRILERRAHHDAPEVGQGECDEQDARPQQGPAPDRSLEK